MRHMRTIEGSELNSSPIVNNDARSYGEPAQVGSTQGHGRPAYRRATAGVMPLAYVLLGAIAFPLVLVAAITSGMGLLNAGVTAFCLSGPLAFTVYLGLALTVKEPG